MMMMNVLFADRAWAAGLFDGDGCVRISKRTRAGVAGCRYTILAKVQMTHLPTVEVAY